MTAAPREMQMIAEIAHVRGVLDAPLREPIEHLARDFPLLRPYAAPYLQPLGWAALLSEENWMDDSDDHCKKLQERAETNDFYSPFLIAGYQRLSNYRALHGIVQKEFSSMAEDLSEYFRMYEVGAGWKEWMDEGRVEEFWTFHHPQYEEAALAVLREVGLITERVIQVRASGAMEAIRDQGTIVDLDFSYPQQFELDALGEAILTARSAQFARIYG